MKKLQAKEKKKLRKKKALGAYNKQKKQECCKCSKYSHKLGHERCPENKMKTQKNIRKRKRMRTKIKHSMEYATMKEKRAFKSELSGEKVWH